MSNAHQNQCPPFGDGAEKIHEVVKLVLTVIADSCDGSRSSVVDACAVLGVAAVSGVIGADHAHFMTQCYTTIASKIPQSLPLLPPCTLPALAREPRKITVAVLREHLRAAGLKLSGLKSDLRDRIRITVAPPRLYKIMPQWRREEKALRRHLEERRIVDGRLKILQDVFAERQLEVRSDSRLCYGFTMRGVGDPRDILRVMDEMRFYFKRTNYSTIRNQCYEAERDMRYGRYSDSDSDSGSGYGPIDGLALSERAKHIAFRQYCDALTTQEKVQEALADFYLPPSLRARVEKLSDTLVAP